MASAVTAICSIAIIAITIASAIITAIAITMTTTTPTPLVAGTSSRGSRRRHSCCTPPMVPVQAGRRWRASQQGWGRRLVRTRSRGTATATGATILTERMQPDAKHTDVSSGSA